MYHIALAILVTSVLASCGIKADCYQDGKVCRKGVYYKERPSAELFFIPDQKPDTFNPIIPQDGNMGFLIKAVEQKGVLYIAYQIYTGHQTCEVKPYIYNMAGDFEIKVYAFELHSDDKYSLVPISGEQKKYLQEWVDSLKIDKKKSFSCMEGGKVEYSDWWMM